MANQSARCANISVVIAVKDRPDEMRLAVQSVLAQSLLPRELIIIDDSSRIPVKRDLIDDDAVLIRILRNEHNRGAAASYNRGVREAKFPIVSFLDSDDCFSHDYIALISEQWQNRSPRPVCIVTGFDWCTNDLRPYRRQLVTEGISKEKLLSKGNYAGGTSVFSVDRNSFLSVGGFPELPGSSDWGLLIKLSEIGNIVVVPKSLVLYRSPSATSLETDTKKYRKQILSTLAIVKSCGPAERRMARPVALKYVAYNLAQANRPGLSWKIIRMVIAEKYAVDGMIYRTVLANVAGAKYYARLLDSSARVRACWRSFVENSNFSRYFASYFGKH